MKIAYLVNQYPKVSHSFIRREIAAIEASGLSVSRFSIRSCESELVDSEDKLELQKTRIVLGVGILGLLLNLFKVAINRPIPWLRGLFLALKIGKSSNRGILYHIIYLAEACILLNWFHESGITHLHAHFGTNPTTVAMLCQAIGGPPYSFTVHGPEEFDQPKSLALTEKINRAAFVVTISNFSRGQLYRWCDHQQWKKIHVVRCGVDNYFLNCPTTAITSEPNLVCVGRLCEQKGQLLLIEAVKQLAIEGLQCNLTLVGDGLLRPEIETLIANYGLEQHIKITGWASGAEVQKYIMNSRAFILASFAEGLPVVIMEALALERPVVSTYIAGIPELVRPGVNGWLVPSGSVEALAEAMHQVLQFPPDKLEQMGKAGHASVKDMHNIAQEASKLINLFRENHKSPKFQYYSSGQEIEKNKQA
ncbi:glycosyltransferase family 4 protein [Nostocaceae cyanobacterium CENA357]|uniref:Glycosyltransferase family 4 protein n=1 Tax=Atlanticothrix silvestris CENA357 TaxID=1725252 RepID=A0A8J7HIR1_9CYAN|nr:glycosyltransferase family 4 protein [Atlanticothrix silvestris]MBH8553905.1 glycosyltransferase family 4 protein [Atlanticothrix silvestris CENA357]